MELEEAVLILVLGYVAIMGFWLSGLSYLVLRKPQPVGADDGYEVRNDPNSEKSMFRHQRKSQDNSEEEPVELKEAPWEAEEETFEDEEPPKGIAKEKSKENPNEQKDTLEGSDGKIKPKEPSKVCPKCEKKASYVEKYDRYYCYHCSEYLECVEEKKEEVVESNAPEGEVEKMVEEEMGEQEEVPLETEDEINEEGAQEEEVEEKVTRETHKQEEVHSEPDEEGDDDADGDQGEHLEAIKELEEEAQEQKKEQKAKEQYEEKLAAPWKIEEELLNNEERLGESEKRFLERVMAQDKSKEQAEVQEEKREEAQTIPTESEKEEHTKESEEDEVYECPVCGYEIGADTDVCPRCESELH